jgi:hypothetical protein
LIEDYFRWIETLVADTSIVRFFNITYDKRSTSIGFIRGSIYFLDGSLLYMREFVDVEYGSERYMYAYHYQRPDGALVFRYNNAPHFSHCPLFLITSTRVVKPMLWQQVRLILRQSSLRFGASRPRKHHRHK